MGPLTLPFAWGPLDANGRVAAQRRRRGSGWERRPRWDDSHMDIPIWTMPAYLFGRSSPLWADGPFAAAGPRRVLHRAGARLKAAAVPAELPSTPT